MATAIYTTTANRFHNLSPAQLADEIGRADAIMKAAEAELKALKATFVSRGVNQAIGDSYTVTAAETIAGRLDAKAVREFLGAAVASRFEVATISTTVRIKPTARTLAVAMAAA